MGLMFSSYFYRARYLLIFWLSIPLNRLSRNFKILIPHPSILFAVGKFVMPRAQQHCTLF
jgi:hypothetical protein